MQLLVSWIIHFTKVLINVLLDFCRTGCAKADSSATVFTHFGRCLNLFQSITTLELNYFVFETFYLLPFLASVRRLNSRTL